MKTFKQKIAYLMVAFSFSAAFLAVPALAHAESGSGSGGSTGGNSHKTTESNASATSGTQVKQSGETNKSATAMSTAGVETETETEHGTTTTTTKTEDNATKAERASRVDNYKKQFKETLTDVAKIRIADRCTAAQGVVKSKADNNGIASDKRATIYDGIASDMQNLSVNLKAKGLDTTILDANITVLQTKIDTFKTAKNTYQQALADLALLDCKSDPAAFKSALTAARANQTTVLKASQDVRKYITDTIKPTLKDLKAALKAQETTSNSN